MNAYMAALGRATVVQAIPAPHLDWLTRSNAGSRLARHNLTGELGHVYPDVDGTPDGWTIIATKDGTPRRRGRRATP